ncbi:histone acetyltransferase HTATIP [Strigomonas culicis]|nr:histone acetyltransferase HTATIP [Strigomonas culicis]|eukprot:EPY28880.1 histone acetyltransferase HTATIP [Strigomonas culicis]
MGAHEVETWYFSPYHMARPEVQQLLQRASTYYAGSTELQLGSGHTADGAAAAQPLVRYATKSLTLHLCPYCLEPFADDRAVVRHLRFVCQRHPPGAEIYRDPVRQLLVLELDGKMETTFCQNLALLSKLFLEHKALDHDMTPFLFYVLCSIQPHGLEVLGYFSKEKQTPEMYNLSCILVLPQFQSRGVGRFLIELSYELSRREGRLGTPEKPLSDLGEKLYGSYWTESVTMAIARGMEEGHCITVDYVVQATAITQADVMRTLQTLNITKDSRINIADETVQSCFLKRMRRESDARNYTFYPHLLCWAPGMYDEVRGNPPPPTYAFSKAEDEDSNSS